MNDIILHHYEVSPYSLRVSWPIEFARKILKMSHLAPAS